MLSVSVLEAVALFGRYLSLWEFVRTKEAPTKRKHNLFKEKKQKIQEKLSCIVQNFAVCLVTNVRLKIKKKKNLPASSDLKKSGLRTNFFFAWPYQKRSFYSMYAKYEVSDYFVPRISWQNKLLKL